GRRSAADLRRHDQLSGFHRGLARRVHGRQGHLRAPEQRLVQRPVYLLSRLRPAGDHHEDRLRQVLPGGRGPLPVPGLRGAAVGLPPHPPRLPPPPPPPPPPP